MFEEVDDSGWEQRYEYTLDETGHRIMGEDRHILIPDRYEANASIEGLESGPAELPPDNFDTSGFTPLWGGDPVQPPRGLLPEQPSTDGARARIGADSTREATRAQVHSPRSRRHMCA